MMKLRNCILIIFVLAVFSLLFYGCEPPAAITFNDIKIIGEDVDEVPEGNYSLRYTIENLDKYKRDHQVDFTITVTDKFNQQVPLINDRILYVETNNSYLISILVTSDDKFKAHNYSVIAVKTTVTVTFTAGEYNHFEDFTQDVYYGEDLSDLPEVPELEENGDIINSYWTAENPDNVSIGLPAPVISNSLINLRNDLTLYAFYEYDPNTEYTISFETYGGTEIEPIVDVYNAGFTTPPIPQKSEHAFFGWYHDNEFDKRYYFPENPTMPPKNITLHARWIDQIEDATEKDYFEYETVENPNMKKLGWLKLKAKTNKEMPKNLVIPRFIDDKPVVEIAPSAFVNKTEIESVILPLTIVSIGTSAFRGKEVSEMSLETVTIEETQELIQINDWAFENNINLTQINIPDSVERINKSVFDNCINLNTVTFGENSKLHTIKEKAFNNCQSLESIELPKSLRIIENKAFFNCSSLQTVVLKNQDETVNITNSSFAYQEQSLEKKLPLTFYVPEEIIDEYRLEDSPYDYEEYDIQPIFE